VWPGGGQMPGCELGFGRQQQVGLLSFTSSCRASTAATLQLLQLLEACFLAPVQGHCSTQCHGGFGTSSSSGSSRKSACAVVFLTAVSSGSS
jgi:hypothetical protein